MSKLAVANIIFESTEANRIEYTGNNVIRVRANGGFQLPYGTTAQRASPETGLLRFNTDLGLVESYGFGGWATLPDGPFVNGIYTVVNSAFSVANSAYESANNVAPQVTPAFNTANAAFAAANNITPQIAPSYNTANAAFNQANAVYTVANTKFSSSGGTITGSVEINADLTVHGNTRFIDQQTLSVGDPLIYLAANNYTSDVVDIGFIANYVNATSANVHTGLYRSSGTKEYYLFYGYDREPLNNYIDPTGNNIQMAVLNTTVRTSNLILGGANAISTIGAAYTKANNAIANTDGVTHTGNLVQTGVMTLNKFPFYEATANIDYSYTINTGMNALTPGPVTVASGVVVTVNPGSTWTVT